MATGALQPAEVLTKKEFEARAAKLRQERREEQAQHGGAPGTALGALAGDLLARAIGGNPKLGRKLGALAASTSLRQKMAEALAHLGVKKR